MKFVTNSAPDEAVELIQRATSKMVVRRPKPGVYTTDQLMHMGVVGVYTMEEGDPPYDAATERQRVWKLESTYASISNLPEPVNLKETAN